MHVLISENTIIGVVINMFRLGLTASGIYIFFYSGFAASDKSA
jgi:hypothetical protein